MADMVTFVALSLSFKLDYGNEKVRTDLAVKKATSE